jgi:hypothetical protein
MQPPRATTERPPLALVGPHLLLPDSRNGVQAKRRPLRIRAAQEKTGAEPSKSYMCSRGLSSGWPSPPGLSACDGWGGLIFRHTLVATVVCFSFPFPFLLIFLQSCSLVNAHRAYARAVNRPRSNAVKSGETGVWSSHLHTHTHTLTRYGTVLAAAVIEAAIARPYTPALFLPHDKRRATPRTPPE